MKPLVIEDLSSQATLARDAAGRLRGGYSVQYEQVVIQEGTPARPVRPFPFSIFDGVPGAPTLPDLPGTSPLPPSGPLVDAPRAPISPTILF